MYVKCNNCPSCKKEMTLLYNDFYTCSLLGMYPEIRGQFCDNKKCKAFGIERRHERENEQMTREEYKSEKPIIDKYSKASLS